MSKKINREFLMQASKFERAKHRSAGMYLSEKLDGWRAVWIPATVGMSNTKVPFANRLKNKKDQICTGLWSRYGHIIHAPSWFTKGFPDYPLDGEIWGGRGNFNKVSSACQKPDPVDYEWDKLYYRVFARPTYHQLFETGRINNQFHKHSMNLEDTLLALGLSLTPEPVWYFDAMHNKLIVELPTNTRIQYHDQFLLPFKTPAALEIIDSRMEEVVAQGGEGLVLRSPSTNWEPTRSIYLQKLKPYEDAEATVIGFKAGEEGKDGTLLGKLGSLLLRWEHGTFSLSGFNFDERTLTSEWSDWARNHPGELFPDCDPCYLFKRGDVVTFRYRELTPDKAPKEARYHRKLVV